MKKNNIIKALLIGTVCMAAVCGCGNGAIGGGNAPDEEIVGADWRTWGIIDDYGTLTLDGADTDVCVCLFADRAELYYDEENQNLFKTIEFPEKLSTEEYEKLSIEFGDYNGDDNTDVAFIVGTENTVDRRFSYLYDQGEFVYDAFSAFPNESNTDEGEDEGVEGFVDFSGRYTEPDTGRCLIEINMERDETYTIIVNWKNGAADEYIWAIMGATYGEYGDELVYEDALYYHRTYEDEENYTDEDIYDDGTGRFYMTEGGMLGWESDNIELDGIDGEVMFECLDR